MSPVREHLYRLARPSAQRLAEYEVKLKSRPCDSRVAATQGLPARSVLQLPSAMFLRQRAAAPATAGSLPLQSLREGQRCHRTLAAGRDEGEAQRWVPIASSKRPACGTRRILSRPHGDASESASLMMSREVFEPGRGKYARNITAAWNTTGARELSWAEEPYGTKTLLGSSVRAPAPSLGVSG